MEYLWLIPLVLVLLTSPLWRGWLTDKAAAAGRNAGDGFAAKRVPAALQALGTTLVLHAAPEQAARLVDSVIAQKPKKYSVRGPGQYGISFIDPSDVSLQLRAVPQGSELLVTGFRDYSGFPQGAPLWQGLTEELQKAAAAAGVATSAGGVVTYARVELIDPDNRRWAIQA